MMKKSVTPIGKTNITLTAQVQERIREAILENTLPPGSRINQQQLADDLGVSIVPVREALKGLEAEGLVKIVPRRGVFITEISLTDLDELYEARRIIEGEAIYRAVDHLTEDDFLLLEALAAKMRQATAENDFATFMDLNREFHMHIYVVAANRYLYDTITSLWERSELYRYRYVLVERNATTIHEEHTAIIKACRDHDKDLARYLAREHIHHTQAGMHLQLKSETEEVKE